MKIIILELQYPDGLRLDYLIQVHDYETEFQITDDFVQSATTVGGTIVFLKI